MLTYRSDIQAATAHWKYTALCTLNTDHYTLHTAYCILHTEHSILHIALLTLYNAHFTLHTDNHCYQVSLLGIAAGVKDVRVEGRARLVLCPTIPHVRITIPHVREISLIK